MKPNFTQLMIDAGLPITEASAKTQWDAELVKHDITIENNSPFSPFWRTIKAIITKPVVALFEWVATIVMPDLYILTASREALINLHGPSRNVSVFNATYARGILIFSRNSGDGVLSIPVGSIVSSDEIGGKVYQVKLLDSAVFKEGETITQVMVQAVNTGIGYNLPESSYYKLDNHIEGVTVKNESDWLISPGGNEEETEAYRTRIINVFGTAGRWHTNAVYKQIISDFGIAIENIEITNGAPRGAGTANAHIFLEVGLISTALINVINDHVRVKNYHGHGDDFMVYAIPQNEYTLIANYSLHDNAQDIKTDLESFIKAAFRLNNAYQPTRPRPNEVFSISLLKGQLHNEFPTLKTISFDQDDIDCGLWLPKLTSLVITNE